MAENKFTPGPWIALPEECDRAYIRIRGTRLGDRYKVANVLTPVYEGVHEREAEETRANARLIAAAPELFEALAGLDRSDWLRHIEEQADSVRGSDVEADVRQTVATARAALRKALGDEA